MAGTWGISADLTKIPDSQRAAILGEIKHYRRLNALRRGSVLYDVIAPRPAQDLARITFYDTRASKACVIVYRWDRQGAFDVHVPLAHLPANARYRVDDVDAKGAEFVRGGLKIHLAPERMSALVFVEAE
jgi:hypothetical protein